ncbi:MAG: hypothetical protein VYE68_02310 [Acidobacteriota bacterium]|nr:hypothetical protein [Acidobacteriota bacterium]
MKTLTLALLTFVVSIPVAAQDSSEDNGALVPDYTSNIETDNMSLMVIHLNDVTTDALFSPPSKYALRAQARTNTMFFVQGVAKGDLRVSTDYELAQVDQLTRQGPTLRTTAVNISNFETGTELSDGEQFQGIITTPSQALNLSAPFEVKLDPTGGNYTIGFRFSQEAVERLER